MTSPEFTPPESRTAPEIPDSTNSEDEVGDLKRKLRYHNVRDGLTKTALMGGTYAALAGLGERDLSPWYSGGVFAAGVTAIMWQSLRANRIEDGLNERLARAGKVTELPTEEREVDS